MSDGLETLEEERPIARDLFGEPIPRETAARRRKPPVRFRTDSIDAANDAGQPVCSLRLPARWAIEGSILGNPLRQLAEPAGIYEGTFEAVELSRLIAWRFKLLNGRSLLIVAKKTRTAMDGEPVLLVPGAETIEAIT